MRIRPVSTVSVLFLALATSAACSSAGPEAVGSQPEALMQPQCSGTHCAREISQGASFACAAVGRGSIKCWGDNSSGELGIGSSTGPDICGFGEPCSTTPLSVSGLRDAVSVSVGGVSSIGACAVLSDGRVRCWGDNSSGGLGIGNASGPSTCTGAQRPCATKPVDVPKLTGVVATAIGGNHRCALRDDGTVSCWGANDAGQLGIGASSPTVCNGYPCSPSPVRVPGLHDVVAIALGTSSSCALLADGTVECWGDNTYGQLGNGTVTGPDTCTAFATPCSTAPAPVAGLSDIVGIAAGGISMCALSKAGTVQCWGSNLDGQLGDGSTGGSSVCNGFPCSATPGAVAGLTSVRALGAGTCALSRRHGVECWGTNENGELGTGTATGPQTCVGGPCSTSPVAVPSLESGVVQLSGTCALLSDGTVSCWGSNIDGQLGNGTPATGPQQCAGPCSTTPTPVSL